MSADGERQHGAEQLGAQAAAAAGRRAGRRRGGRRRPRRPAAAVALQALAHHLRHEPHQAAPVSVRYYISNPCIYNLRNRFLFL